MKPDWKDAPEWANYVAMDSGGEWYWYEEKPFLGDECWLCDGISDIVIDETGKKWVDTLQSRPGSNEK